MKTIFKTYLFTISFSKIVTQRYSDMNYKLFYLSSIIMLSYIL